MKIANWGCTSFFDTAICELCCGDWDRGGRKKNIANDLGAKFDLWNSKSETLGQGH